MQGTTTGLTLQGLLEQRNSSVISLIHINFRGSDVAQTPLEQTEALLKDLNLTLTYEATLGRPLLISQNHTRLATPPGNVPPSKASQDRSITTRYNTCSLGHNAPWAGWPRSLPVLNPMPSPHLTLSITFDLATAL